MIQALAATNANAFDAVAVHPYTDATGATPAQLADGAIALINRAAATLVACTGPGPGGAPRQQIWVTEMGWSDRAGLGDDRRRFPGLLGCRRPAAPAPATTSARCSGTTCATTHASRSRDDQLGLRYTNADGSDAGPKPAWSVFSHRRADAGKVAPPGALSDSGPYVARARPPAPPARDPPSASASVSALALTDASSLAAAASPRIPCRVAPFASPASPAFQCG